MGAGDIWTIFIASSLSSCKPKMDPKKKVLKKEERIGEILNQTLRGSSNSCLPL